MKKPAVGNDREGKRRVLYDGHNRRAGVSAANDTAHWRRLRRAAKRWLTARMKD